LPCGDWNTQTESVLHITAHVQECRSWLTQ
jgi:hypothetical protein